MEPLSPQPQRPPLRLPPPAEPAPTLADAVPGGAAQVESGLAAAVLRPLHLRASRRAAEGRVPRFAALEGDCGEKTPLGPGPAHLGLTLEEPRDRGVAPSQSLLWSRERKGTGLTETQPSVQGPPEGAKDRGRTRIERRTKSRPHNCTLRTTVTLNPRFTYKGLKHQNSSRDHCSLKLCSLSK